MKPEIKYDSQMLIDMAEKILSELPFMLVPSQHSKMIIALIAAYKHGKADGLKEAIELISDAT
tara:strand:+ start:1170 stop:1358 length:189 start_codon:yes stop_codon:yes gene_type:complete